MELLKTKNEKIHKEYERVIFNVSKKGIANNVFLSDLVDNYIKGFSTQEEQDKLKEFNLQISDMIDKIYLEKKTMIKEIDVGYLFSSHLQHLCTERAKTYMNALDRIEIYYEDNSIHNFLMRYKNL